MTTPNIYAVAGALETWVLGYTQETIADGWLNVSDYDTNGIDIRFSTEAGDDEFELRRPLAEALAEFVKDAKFPLDAPRLAALREVLVTALADLDARDGT